MKGSKILNDKLKKTCYNYKPDIIITGHADLISKEQIQELKDDYPNVKFAQWFLDPLNKKGPDYERNKTRILDKIELMDSTFVTTSPSALNFLPKKIIIFLYQILVMSLLKRLIISINLVVLMFFLP